MHVWGMVLLMTAMRTLHMSDAWARLTRQTLSYAGPRHQGQTSRCQRCEVLISAIAPHNPKRMFTWHILNT